MTARASWCRRKLNVKSAKQLNGATVCVQPGTTTELNLADYFRANKMTFKPVVIEKLDEVLNAYFAGRCDVYTTDHSGLISTARHARAEARRARDPAGDHLQGAARPGGAPRRRPLVRRRQWSMFAMIEAEELGLTRRTSTKAESTNPKIQRFVGATGDIGKMLGLDNNWAFNIVKQVGNYGESFDTT